MASLIRAPSPSYAGVVSGGAGPVTSPVPTEPPPMVDSSPSVTGSAATNALRRGLAATVATGWQGVLNERLSLAPRRKSLLGE